MAAMTDVAQAFFVACESGRGWDACKPFCAPNATFSAQAEPLLDVKTLAADQTRQNVAAYAVFYRGAGCRPAAGAFFTNAWRSRRRRARIGSAEVTMTGRAPSVVAQPPEWIAAEMPPGYQTRLLEIQRLSDDLHSMDRIGNVLWGSGDALRSAVGAVFGAIKCEVETPAAGPIAVKLGDARRLLVIVSDAVSPLRKSDDELALAFHALQFAGPGDRVVVVAGHDRETPPADRADAILPDALAVLQRMGVALLTTATLFRLWRLSLEDAQKGRQALERLHAQDGGLFALPPR